MTHLSYQSLHSDHSKFAERIFAYYANLHRLKQKVDKEAYREPEGRMYHVRLRPVSVERERELLKVTK